MLDEQHAEADFARRLRTFLRHPVWKQIKSYLDGRFATLLDQLGQTGLSADDRAMLHGKLAFCQELTLHLPASIVEQAINAAQLPSPEEDDPESSLPSRDHQIEGL